MTIYSTDFSEYSTGSPPSDWTQRYDSSDDWTVESGSGLGSQQLQVNPGATEYQSAISWDDLGTTGDLKILAKIQSPSSGGGDYYPGIMIRGSGSAGSEDCYTFRLYGSLNRFQLTTFNSGSASNLVYASHTISKGIWYWIRVEASGTSLKARIWDDGNSEPETWGIDTTNSDHSTGFSGLMSDQNDGWCDYFSVGTGGDDPDDPTATTTTTTTTTVSTTTTTTFTTTTTTTTTFTTTTTTTFTTTTTTTTTAPPSGENKNTVISIMAMC